MNQTKRTDHEKKHQTYHIPTKPRCWGAEVCSALLFQNLPDLFGGSFVLKLFRLFLILVLFPKQALA